MVIGRLGKKHEYPMKNVFYSFVCFLEYLTFFTKYLFIKSFLIRKGELHAIQIKLAEEAMRMKANKFHLMEYLNQFISGSVVPCLQKKKI